MARIGWIAGLAGVAGAAYVGGRRERRRVAVTLFSEPHFRGVRETFVPDGTARPLSRTRLPSVGSVRVERAPHIFRRAGIFPTFLRAALDPQADPSARSEARAWLGLAALRALEPGSWQRVRDPAGDRQSWVRLWAVDPATVDSDGADPDGADPDAAGELWQDVVEDDADVSAWPTRYVEAGVRNPSRG